MIGTVFLKLFCGDSGLLLCLCARECIALLILCTVELDLLCFSVDLLGLNSLCLCVKVRQQGLQLQPGPKRLTDINEAFKAFWWVLHAPLSLFHNKHSTLKAMYHYFCVCLSTSAQTLVPKRDLNGQHMFLLYFCFVSILLKNHSRSAECGGCILGFDWSERICTHKHIHTVLP